MGIEKNTNTRDEITVSEKLVLSLTYAAKRSGGIIIEYPLECIKTRWQANPEITSLPKVIRYSYQKYGLLGYYNGFLPSLTRKTVAQLYRWPIILQLPDFYRSLLQDFSFVRKDREKANYSEIAIANTLTALTIATVETPLVSPIETCKLDLIVNRDQIKTIFGFFKSNWSLKLQFIGTEALYLKEVFGWTSFLVSCNILRRMVKDYNGDNVIRPSQIIPISIAVGLANATAVTPWDVTRSQIQKMKKLEGISLGNVMPMLIKQHGLKCLFIGWSIRAFQLAVATALSIPIMEQFEADLTVTDSKLSSRAY